MTASPLDILSKREREVLEAVVAGKQLKEIAADMNRSLKTIHHHRHAIGRKLGVRSVGEVCRFYYQLEISKLKGEIDELRRALGMKEPPHLCSCGHPKLSAKTNWCETCGAWIHDPGH